ncbi:hypothetical protein [Lysinibacillus fusiformis]|uniref:hypothetical protein n=1 Tax=Lysinibacillus fusiformis TaxID=28031 RepID=UPI003CFEC55D
MKVFISWSGERSRKVGELLDEWLQCVIQAINPWRSDRDIDRGSLWFTQITNQLEETSIGIVCITQENKNNPWILFESGAIAKGLSTSRVCTFLIDLEPSDIKDPLAQFNHTKPTYDGVKSLVRTLNSVLEDKSLPEKILDQAFETYWPQFEEKFRRVLDGTTQLEEVESRSEEDILSELLYITRGMDKRIRDLEYTKENNNRPKTSYSFSTKYLNIIKKDIRNMISNGENEEDIISKVSNRHDVKESVVKDMYKSILNEGKQIEIF